MSFVLFAQSVKGKMIRCYMSLLSSPCNYSEMSEPWFMHTTFGILVQYIFIRLKAAWSESKDAELAGCLCICVEAKACRLTFSPDMQPWVSKTKDFCYYLQVSINTVLEKHRLPSWLYKYLSANLQNIPDLQSTFSSQNAQFKITRLYEVIETDLGWEVGVGLWDDHTHSFIGSWEESCSADLGGIWHSSR